MLSYFLLIIVLYFVFRFTASDYSFETMFGSSLLPAVCRRAHKLFVFVFVCVVHSGVQHILGFILVIFFVLFSLYCQFLWIVLFVLSLGYSLMCI